MDTSPEAELIEILGIGLLKLDEIGLILFINDSGAYLLGFDSPWEIAGKRYIWEFFWKEKDIEERKAFYGKLLDIAEAEGDLFDFACIFSSKKGSDFCGILRGKVLRDEHQRRFLSGAIFKLSKEEEIYMRVFRGLPTAIFEIEGESKLVFINEFGARELFGCSAKDMIGKDVRDFYADRDFAKKITGEIVKVLSREGKLRMDRLLLRRADGEFFWVTSLVKGIYDKDGKLIGREGMLIKVGDYEASQGSALFEHYRGLLRTIGHDIRSLSSSIIGFLSVLRDTELDEFQRDLVDKAFSGAQHLTELLDNLLSSFSLQSGKMELIETPFDLKEALEEVAVLISPRLREGVELRVKVRKLPYRLVGDSYKLKQIVLNLLSNSAKFTESGFVELAIDEILDEGNSVRVLIHVKDTGPGIPEDKREEIFMPFSRLSSSHEGTGLGLYISKSMALLMGGDLWLGDSKEGAIFYLRLPFKKEKSVI